MSKHMAEGFAISIHAPPRGATGGRMSDISGKSFQFTPLREGRHYEPSRYYWAQLISIHAPPRGATWRVRQRCKHHHISIHAPPRGATALAGSSRFTEIDFNSRPSARGDEVEQISMMPVETISIHAPPRGATASAGWAKRRPVFQFTPLREGRPDAHRGKPAHAISIHAPPRGATFQRPERLGSSLFQFTPLREGRPQKICNFCKSFVQPLQISMA